MRLAPQPHTGDKGTVEACGLFGANQLRIKQRPFHRLQRSYRPFFWDSQGVILINYLQKDDDHGIILQRFIIVLKKKRPRLQQKKVPFHHNNAPAHSSHIVVLDELRYSQA